MKIRVRVFHREGRKYFEAQWTDPTTGLKKTKSTGLTTRKEAERYAAKLEVELEASDGQMQGRINWADFRKKYEAEVLPFQRKKTRQKMKSTMNAVETLLNPKYLTAVNAAQISKFQAALKGRGNVDPTVKSHLSCLRKLLSWATTMGYFKIRPVIKMPSGKVTMKGRPPTQEEFERINEKAEIVVGPDRAPSFQFTNEGLWWSGLRLVEAMELHWTNDKHICVDLTGKYPMFRIQAQTDKARTFRLLPMAPDFAAFLLSRVPEEARHGFVFNPMPDEEGIERLSAEWVGKLISRMGEAANVKVAERDRFDDDGKPYADIKYASAHDFRRAFGFRWSRRVLPPVLMEMMRHASIQTTMEFYVGRNAEATADQAWKAIANESANTSQSPPKTDRVDSPQDDAAA